VKPIYLFYFLLVCFVSQVSRLNAALVMSVHQVGQDVHLIVSGTLNLTALSSHVTAPDSVAGLNVLNSPPVILSGPQEYPMRFPVDIYIGLSDSPFLIGTRPGFIRANSGSGDRVGVSFNNYDFTEVRPVIVVPQGYVSGNSLSSEAIFADTSLDGLGLQRGIYTWSWGSGSTEDSVTLVVPEPNCVRYFVCVALMGFRVRRREQARK
jgi:hypothetical protein